MSLYTHLFLLLLILQAPPPCSAHKFFMKLFADAGIGIHCPSGNKVYVHPISGDLQQCSQQLGQYNETSCPGGTACERFPILIPGFQDYCCWSDDTDESEATVIGTTTEVPEELRPYTTRPGRKGRPIVEAIVEGPDDEDIPGIPEEAIVSVPEERGEVVKSDEESEWEFETTRRTKRPRSRKVTTTTTEEPVTSTTSRPKSNRRLPQCNNPEDTALIDFGNRLRDCYFQQCYQGFRCEFNKEIRRFICCGQAREVVPPPGLPMIPAPKPLIPRPFRPRPQPFGLMNEGEREDWSGKPAERGRSNHNENNGCPFEEKGGGAKGNGCPLAGNQKNQWGDYNNGCPYNQNNQNNNENGCPMNNRINGPSVNPVQNGQQPLNNGQNSGGGGSSRPYNSNNNNNNGGGQGGNQGWNDNGCPMNQNGRGNGEGCGWNQNSDLAPSRPLSQVPPPPRSVAPPISVGQWNGNNGGSGAWNENEWGEQQPIRASGGRNQGPPPLEMVQSGDGGRRSVAPPPYDQGSPQGYRQGPNFGGPVLPPQTPNWDYDNQDGTDGGRNINNNNNNNNNNRNNGGGMEWAEPSNQGMPRPQQIIGQPRPFSSGNQGWTGSGTKGAAKAQQDIQVPSSSPAQCPSGSEYKLQGSSPRCSPPGSDSCPLSHPRCIDAPSYGHPVCCI